jgi:nicotinate-nucleotide adenylyltransferase
VTRSDHQRKIAFYGGTFDPVHRGHVTIARRLIQLFDLDEFWFLPAYHAPHKAETKPTSGYHRFAMLILATQNEPKIRVSTLELDHATKRYSVDTLAEVTAMSPNDKVFFVMGADSWMDITTWHDWERVLLMTNHIVVTRPGYPIGFDHVTDAVRERIVDVRNEGEAVAASNGFAIYITDAVELDVSATDIRDDIQADDRLDRVEDVPEAVANYIEKYDLYK